MAVSVERRQRLLRVALVLTFLGTMAGVASLVVPIRCESVTDDPGANVYFKVEYDVPPVRHLFLVPFEDGECESIAVRRLGFLA